MPNTTIAIDTAVRERLKTFGHAGMTYNEILARMMDEIEREAFIQEMRRILAETKDEDWVDLDDVEWEEQGKVRAAKRAGAKRGARAGKTRAS